MPDAEVAHANNIDVYVIGVTSVVNVAEIRLISSAPQQENETYWLLSDFQSFDQIFQSTEQSICYGEFVETAIKCDVYASIASYLNHTDAILIREFDLYIWTHFMYRRSPNHHQQHSYWM